MRCPAANLKIPLAHLGPGLVFAGGRLGGDDI
jgi:hypothetical protein